MWRHVFAPPPHRSATFNHKAAYMSNMTEHPPGMIVGYHAIFKCFEELTGLYGYTIVSVVVT